MQRLPAPRKLDKNLLSTSVQEGSVELMNAFADRLGGVSKRPGLLLNQVISAQGGIQDIYYWPSKRKYVVVAGGQLWATDQTLSATFQVVSGTDKLPLGTAKIVDTGRWLYICGSSGRIMVWNGTGQAAFTADGVAPENVSAITTLNQRVIANKLGTNQIWFTLPPDLENPDAELVWSSFLSYGRNNEDVIGLTVSANELIALKRDSMQAFFDDGATPYKPIIGSQKFHGIVNARAVCELENATFFVSPDRIVRMLSNRDIVDISTQPMAEAFSRMREFNDAGLFSMDGKIFLNFPSENRTYAFDPRVKAWSQISSYRSGSDDEFIARSATVASTVGAADYWIIGAKDGGVYLWDYSSFTDAGEPIRVLIRTGHYDFGTSDRKHSTRMVAKVSLEPRRLPEIPEFTFPDARRCEVYFYQTILPEGVTATITGLPTGFNVSQVGRVLTVSGGTENFAGSSNLSVTLRDSRGFVYNQTKVFVVEDAPDIEVGVLSDLPPEPPAL